MRIRTTRGLATAVVLVVLALPAAAGADPIGSQFQISFTGDPGDSSLSANHPAVAYNPTNDQYLTVWEAQEVFGDWEIWGRFVGGDGTPLGDKFQISNVPGSTDSKNTSTACAANELGGCDPDVAYNSRDNEFLVVWEQRTPISTVAGPAAPTHDIEIYAQRLDTAGNQLTTNGEGPPDDARISNAIQTTTAHSLDPKVAYNATDDQYLAVWTVNRQPGQTGQIATQNIYGQRMDAQGNEMDTGNELGDDDATMTTNGVTANFCGNNDGSCQPDVTHDSANNRWFVVWLENLPDNCPPCTNEVFARHFDSTGLGLAPEFQVSDMGTDEPKNPTSGAFSPATIYNPVSGEFMVVWSGGAFRGNQVFGQRVPPFGGSFQPGQFQISNLPQGSEGYEAEFPDVAADTLAGEYLVVWNTDANEGPEPEEVFGQKLTSTGGKIATNDVQISSNDVGEEFGFRGENPGVVYNPTRCEYLPVWAGGIPAGKSRKFEIFGRRHGAAPLCGTAAAPPAAPGTPAAPTAPKPGRPSVRVAGVTSACISRSKRITFRVTPKTGATLTSVRVTLDGKRIASTRRTRFSVTVNVKNLKAGRHRLVLTARDSAGNRTVARRTIVRCAQAPQRRAAPRFTG